MCLQVLAVREEAMSIIAIANMLWLRDHFTIAGVLHTYQHLFPAILWPWLSLSQLLCCRIWGSMVEGSTLLHSSYSCQCMASSYESVYCCVLPELIVVWPAIIITTVVVVYKQ